MSKIEKLKGELEHKTKNLKLMKMRKGMDDVISRLEKECERLSLQIESLEEYENQRLAEQANAIKSHDAQLYAMYDKMVGILGKIGDLSQNEELRDKIGYKMYINQYKDLIKDIELREKCCQKVGLPFERPFKALEFLKEVGIEGEVE